MIDVAEDGVSQRWKGCGGDLLQATTAAMIVQTRSFTYKRRIPINDLLLE
ncbi:hypothetical protein [Paenibacillus sp. IHB B 3415]|nr:hypothetical protein [Paenibacillus sp. IHB B 3415]